MSVAPWLLPVLWREHDWRAALERLGSQLADAETTPEKLHKAVVELARAFEYIEPDRRKAIAIIELAGGGSDLDRARELAVELGWWTAYARLSMLACALEFEPQLLIDEAEAWWDAGHADLCALALAGLRGSERTVQAAELTALVANRDLASHAASTVSRARAAPGHDAADAYVMAARFARAAGQTAQVSVHLEAALDADPAHGKAASFLLALARQHRDSDAIVRYLKARLVGADAATAIDRMRACACALIGSDQHGFALRLLRVALERAYAAKLDAIPGHLAMWTLLAAHASADGTRRELLPFVIEALQASREPIDRVWLGALATEITLRDAAHPVVAGAYAEIVAEHAPDHPIVRELVTTVAECEASEPEVAATTVPPAAITAAAAHVEDSFDVDVDLDETYAVATEASLSDADLDELVEDEQPAPAPAPALPITPSIEPIIVDAPAATPTYLPGVSDPSARAGTQPIPLPVVIPVVAAKLASASAKAEPKPLPSIQRSVAPVSAAQPASPAPIAPIAPASKVNPASLIPASLTKSKLRAPAASTVARAPSDKPREKSDPAPVLEALRTADRPVIPPEPPDPPDAAPRARRISIPIDLRIVLANGKRVAGHSRDISTSGLFVLVNVELTVGEEYGIELMLPAAEPFMEDEYKARARIVRKADGGYGVELIAPDPPLLAALAAL